MRAYSHNNKTHKNASIVTKKIRRRLLFDRFFEGVIVFLSLISALPLLFILIFIAKKGLSVINWKFLVSLPKPVGEIGGGVANAIVGTFILILVASILSIPIGTSVGIYLNEKKDKPISNWIALGVDVLQGVPSIVLGIISYLWFVRPMGHFSALSGGVALAIMMLPVITKSTYETLKLIPESIREASLSLGVPYYKTVIRVILPASMSGIVTGILLGIARIAGETAPLLFTAFGNPYMNLDVTKPVNSLPLLIFNYAISPYEDWHRIAWGASLILIVMVLIINLLAKLLSRKWKTQF